MANNDNEPVIIKKYANRRLYNTETSIYITLEELKQMVKDGRNFVVRDAKSGEDLTRQTLAQIIFDQETKGAAVLPTEFLRQIIGFYDDSMGEVLQHYLAASMNGFMNNQEQMRSYVGKMGKAVEELLPINQFEEMTRQNIAFFEKAVSVFNPFGNYFAADEKEPAKKRK